MTTVDPELRGLAIELVAVRKRAKALGIFTNDRGLLACPNCGLKEDVAINGALITCQDSARGQSIGLRFEPLKERVFRCPACGQSVHGPDAQDLEGGSAE